MRFFVTGGAGFIGSHLCDALIARGHAVTVFDDFSTGREEFLADAKKAAALQIVRGDIRSLDSLRDSMRASPPDWVMHLAANADVRRGPEQTRKDLEWNTIGTWNVLEAMRQSGCKAILFSSTGSVYGEPEIFPTPENAPFPVQTSFYGASKAAGEALIAAHATAFGVTGLVFRFVSILGPRYTHGHVHDFVRALRKDPKRLRVLGDGNQTKSYLHVDDLMSGLLLCIEHERHKSSGFFTYNIGHDEALTVKQSIGHILSELGLEPTLEFSGGQRGWIGDSPRIQLDTRKLQALGWRAKRSLGDSVRDTVRHLVSQPHLLEV